jgi:DNA-binding LacI/PurR family transcriptional regulator
MRSNRPTIKDVALRAGVSPNVVSRVCHPESGEYVSEGSRAKVLEAIRELGYHPDSRARYLRNPRTKTIGFYSGNGTLDFDFEFARAIFEGLQSACEEFDQDLLIFHLMENHSTSYIADKVTSSKVDGIVYHPRPSDTELSETLSKTHKPIVRIGEPFPNIPAVVADDWNGGRRIARHLYGRGHRRVVFRKETYNIVSAQRRYEGFCEAAARLGMAVITTTASSRDDELTDEEQQLLRNFRAEGITAFVCWRDWSAAKVLSYCNENHIRVPNDIAVVGFDGLTPDFCPSAMRLTTLVIEWDSIAEMAVERLFDLIEHREVPDETIHPCSLYIGNTT